MKSENDKFFPMKFHSNWNRKFSDVIIWLSVYGGNKIQQGEEVIMILITGGNYQFCDGMTCPFCKKHCNRAANSVSQSKILKRKVTK